MKEEYIRWYTPHLSREFEMLVFGHGGYPVIAFPTSLGRYYQNKDFHLIDSVAHLVDRGAVKIYCPDGIDSQSWYNQSIHPADRVRTHMAYENVILHDVVPAAQRDTGRAKVCVAGASFGGYHALNFALRDRGLRSISIPIGNLSATTCRAPNSRCSMIHPGSP